MELNKFFLSPLFFVFTLSVLGAELNDLEVHALEEAQAHAQKYGSFQKWEAMQREGFEKRYEEFAQELNALRALIDQESPEKFPFALQLIEKIFGITYPNIFIHKKDICLPLQIFLYTRKIFVFRLIETWFLKI